MKPERWQKIDQLFHSTIEWPPPERSHFLSQECGDDEDLRREVESLLLAHEREGNFLDAPAYEVSTEFFADCLTGLLAGQQIGPYKILSLLGVGGMGEVYLAQDDRLRRRIALKLLSPDFARDIHRVRRFEQEARAASALSHPNVCVIHEIAETEDGRHFIAMEHIDGITLRERIARRPFSVRQALAIADQIAAALSAAHAAGVVHRDIKPENIMLRKDGYVKVLDFGLAKLSEPESPLRGNTSSTISNVHTEPGTQMGTVKYMSPEQLREGVVDERTDVWSLGVVLHEMVTGHTPFEEGSRNEIIASILKRQPAPLAFPDGAVPPEFQRIVARALTKQREDRYQAMSVLATDLKRLHERLRGEEPGDTWSMGYDVAADEQDTKRVRINHRPQTSILWSSALTFASHTAEQVLTEIRERPKTIMFAGLAVAATIFIALNSQRFLNRPQTVVPFQTITMSPLTNAAQSVCAAISADGKLFAHVERKDGMQEVLVTSIATAGSSLVVPPEESKYHGLTFSGDGNYLYFTRSAQQNDAGALYQVALPGGSPRKIMDGVDSPISLSPRGDRFTFVRHNRATGEYSLMIANLDRADERSIATRSGGKRFSVDGPAWSPDEKSIVCGAGWWDRGYHMNLIEVDLASAQERPVSDHEWFSVSQAAWLENESGLIINARERWTGPNQLWRVSYPEGKAVRLTNDVADYDTLSLSRDANTIVAVQRQYLTHIWLAPNGDAQGARDIASKVGVSFGMSWTARGKILFSSMAANNLNISAINSDGSNQTQLTVNAGDNYSPATSPDGHYIVFASNRTGSLEIWRMNADDGSDPKQLTFTDGNSYPSCSPDGQWVFYDHQSDARITAWKVPIDSGNPVQLTDYYARMPVVSPDNQSIACRYYVEVDQRGVAILPVQGGPPTKLLPIMTMEFQRLQWTPDGRALTYIDLTEGVSNIWSYDLDTGSRKKLTNFKTEEIFSYAWSPDYKQLACERGTKLSDVTIINLQK
jgi:eukaryotic-like serine/threonine-protein kinase